VQLQVFALAYGHANFLRLLAFLSEVAQWSLAPGIRRRQVRAPIDQRSAEEQRFECQAS
jgi:hypothetical protein